MPSASFARSEVVEGLVRDAAMAPSMDNAQPWRFRYSDGGDFITLHADPERTVQHSDPQLRALHLGCGAALFNLRVAAQNAGFRPVVTLLPDPDDQQTLASVSLRKTAESLDSRLALLYTAISERRTNRYPFAERPIPVELANLLVEQARAEGARMAFLSGWHLSLVLDVIEEAELSAGQAGEGDGSGDPDAQLWVRTGVKLSDAVAGSVGEGGPDAVADGVADRVADGVAGREPAYGAAPRDGGSSAPVRDFARGRYGPDSDPPPGPGPGTHLGRGTGPGPGTHGAEPLPHLGLLCTEHDRPYDWLVAGQAMERMVLMATREGLATSFAAQALERPELRWLLRDPVWGAGPVQMVIRLGYGPLVPPTSRRPVGEVLEVIP
jgi:hypothetical protein